MKGISWLRGRTLATAALTAAMLLVGCSDEAGFDGGPLAPQEASYARGGHGAERGGRQDARDRDGRGRGEKGRRVNGRKRGGQVGQYKLAAGHLPDRKDVKSEAEIGSRGGCIAAAGHMLCVPAGVLERGQTARFKLQQVLKTLEDGSTIVAVDVKADLEGDDEDFEFGKNGFGFNSDGTPKKVYLFLTYDWSENRPETVTAENGAVLYFPSSVNAVAGEDDEDGEGNGHVVEVLDDVYTTSWNGRGYLVAPLEHFSEYGIGWPNLTKTVTSTVGGLLGGLF